MPRSSGRQLRLALAIIAPSLSMALYPPSAALADESLLADTVVQTATFQNQPAESVLPSSQYVEGSVTEAFADGATTTPASQEPVARSYSGSSMGSVLACSCCNSECRTKEDKVAATKAMKSAHSGLFFGNNFSYLRDPRYDGPNFCGESLKNMDTRFGTISVGGETRFRYHNERNFRGANGLTGNDDNFWLFRQRLYADWQMTNNVRVYGELLDANSSGETFQPLIIEENDLDIQNLFVDLKLFDSGDSSLVTRIGRQELLYGAQRTVSPLDWANTRRTFEGVRALYQRGDFSLDAFWTRPVNVVPKAEDRSDEKEDFFGAYATMNNVGSGSLEAYYLGYNSDNTSAIPILNRNFTFHTLGGRSLGKTDGGMLYDFEGAYQFGDNNTDASHSAGFVALGLGRKMASTPLQPTIWGWYDYASGEEDFDERSIGDGGYHHLFPLAHKYNGFMDLFGRRNLHDINTQIITPLCDRITMLVWYHYLLLAEDTVPYNLVMIPYNQAGNAAEDRELGHEIDILFNINLNPRNNILLGYSHFSGGDYFDSATIGPVDEDNDADFFYAQFQTRY
ncbi:alginate export family protein [Crateriforma conspicua]|uniref:alginate export family protein n=1 Tax=Crateriforma conspicua TaxID=2527996 RepID=UPI001187A157|nr:alginate export family protein [Crateriforma conspicua]QDV62554.1 hypothetical protein Mal65_16880 [Crateriforma conspicua]